MVEGGACVVEDVGAVKEVAGFGVDLLAGAQDGEIESWVRTGE